MTWLPVLSSENTECTPNQNFKATTRISSSTIIILKSGNSIQS
uniref:Uncharacterized protein n=1 Tax=Arundo donax TaxID=35708 RepID=A0A0A9DMJ4_ARUDO